MHDTARPSADTPVFLAGGGETGALMRAFDWSATSLGPPEAWPPTLRTAVQLMLASRQPAYVAWGPELLSLYNDGYLPFLGSKHPRALGAPYAEVWPEVLDQMRPVIEALRGGEAIFFENQPLALVGRDRPMSWFTYSWTPLRGDNGQVAGFYCVATETTDTVLARERQAAERERQAFLLKLSDALRPLSAPADVQQTASRLLAEHLGASRAMYAEMHGEGASAELLIRGQHVRGVELFPERIPYRPFTDEIADEPMREGETLVVADAATDPRLREDVRQNWLATGMAAVVALSAVKDGRVAYIFGVHNPHPRDWSPDEVALVEEVAERTWAAAERARTEVELRESEEGHRAIVETATDYAIFTIDPEGRIETWPAGAQQVYGWTPEEAVGQPLEMTFTPEDRAAGAPERERQEARDKGQALNVRWHVRKDGSRVFIDGVARPLHGPDGQLKGFVKVGQDVTERRATQEALRESEVRFQQFGEASADVLWIRDCESLAFEYVSRAFEDVYGVRIDHVLDGNHLRRWVELIVPDDREKVMDAVRRVREGETVTHDFRILRPDGQVRWIRDTDFPLRDAEGQVQRIGGIAHDVTEQIELQDRLQVLVHELQHRTRNLMGVVRGVTDKTLSSSTSLPNFKERIRDRLGALSRVNGLLSRLDGGHRIAFDELLLTELKAHGVVDPEDDASQVRLEGPQGIRLRSSTVQTLALGLHELATNALKYGALSRPEGRLEVSWDLVDGQDGERRLRVDWRESGVSVAGSESGSGGEVTAPPRRGYGRELIERALPYQLKAKTTYELTPEGVRCSITLPVSSTMDGTGLEQESLHD